MDIPHPCYCASMHGAGENILLFDSIECVLNFWSPSFKLSSFVAETILCYKYVCICHFHSFCRCILVAECIFSHTGATISAKMHAVVQFSQELSRQNGALMFIIFTQFCKRLHGRKKLTVEEKLQP